MTPPITYNPVVTAMIGGEQVVEAQQMQLLSQVPAPLIGPALAGTYALADFVTGSPAAPTNNFLRGNFALMMGVGTTAQYGWMYGLDAMGLPMGSKANTWGTYAGTLLTFAPAVQRIGIPLTGISLANPTYSPAFVRALTYATGAGSSSGAVGIGGSLLKGAGLFGAVLTGSQLGGWATEAATGLDNESDPQSQLAKLAYDRMRSDGWGAFGRSPFGHVMMGLSTLYLEEGLVYAEQAIVRDIKTFAEDSLDATLLALLNNHSAPTQNGSLNVTAFEEGLRNYYSSSSGMKDNYRVIDILRSTRKLKDTEGGLTRFVNEDGKITDRAGFNAYACQLIQGELNQSTRQLKAQFQSQGLVIRGGQVATASGKPFTEAQIKFIRGDGAQLTLRIVRLTNALATLQPARTAAAN